MLKPTLKERLATMLCRRDHSILCAQWMHYLYRLQMGAHGHKKILKWIQQLDQHWQITTAKLILPASKQTSAQFTPVLHIHRHYCFSYSLLWIFSSFPQGHFLRIHIHIAAFSTFSTYLSIPSSSHIIPYCKQEKKIHSTFSFLSMNREKQQKWKTSVCIMWR